MTKQEVSEWLLHSEDNFEYSKHEPLVTLCCVYESDLEDFEVTFAVPIEWLLNFVKTEWSENWNWKRLQKWLLCEYTSEESSDILDKAKAENKIAFWRMD